MIASRSLRHRLSIERAEKIQDPDTGAMITTWVVWAANIPTGPHPTFPAITAQEFFAARTAQTTLDRKLIIRPIPGLTAKDRVDYKGEKYRIEGILPAEKIRDKYVTLLLSTDTRP